MRMSGPHKTRHGLTFYNTGTAKSTKNRVFLDFLERMILIFVPDKGQAARRECGARFSAVKGIDDPGDIVRFFPAQAHFKQGSGDDPDHIIEETAARNAYNSLISVLFYAAGVNCPRKGGCLASCGAEGRKIVFSRKERRCPVHFSYIEVTVRIMGIQAL